MLRAPGGNVDTARVAATTQAVIVSVTERLDRLVSADIDEPHSGPLECIRQSLGPLTALLTELEAEPPERDPFDVRVRPDDLYSLGPMSFADLSPEVHDAGIEWGAAKAFLHRQRHDSPSPPDSD